MGMYTLVRTLLFPFAFILTHATVTLWKVIDPNQIQVATWIVDNIHRPIIHPIFVWLVTNALSVMGSFGEGAIRGFRIYLNNNPPTHHDADKLLYSVGLLVYMWLLYSLIKVTLYGFSRDRHVPPAYLRAPRR